MVFKPGSEDSVQRDIMDWLKAVLPGCFVMHVPNGFHAEGDVEARAKHVARLKGLGMAPGAADLLVFTREGRPFWIECKRPKRGVTSSDQLAFGEAMAKRNVPWAVCSSVADARVFLDSLDIRTREAA